MRRAASVLEAEVGRVGRRVPAARGCRRRRRRRSVEGRLRMFARWGAEPIQASTICARRARRAAAPGDVLADAPAAAAGQVAGRLHPADQVALAGALVGEAVLLDHQSGCGRRRPSAPCDPHAERLHAARGALLVDQAEGRLGGLLAAQLVGRGVGVAALGGLARAAPGPSMTASRPSSAEPARRASSSERCIHPAFHRSHANVTASRIGLELDGCQWTPGAPAARVSAVCRGNAG